MSDYEKRAREIALEIEKVVHGFGYPSRIETATAAIAAALKEAETYGFKAGYLIACCNLVNLHDQPSIACDVLAEAGLSEADVDAMDLSEYDLRALKEIREGRRDDPIASAIHSSKTESEE